ncbi:hypothetical protein [Nocardioides sp.]|uniref:hypothetical protein n=1 Tax=Nocardioides sp. TaxID=35761 RepID=UPI002C25C58E|nr:hypothetical protein [Nocardioides sp.]HXH79557.1 hypothetical protein [Nocardioides sp.]
MPAGDHDPSDHLVMDMIEAIQAQLNAITADPHPDVAAWSPHLAELQAADDEQSIHDAYVRYGNRPGVIVDPDDYAVFREATLPLLTLLLPGAEASTRDTVTVSRADLDIVLHSEAPIYDDEGMDAWMRLAVTLDPAFADDPKAT